MSSLFDDSFLADLGPPSDEEQPPPPEDSAHPGHGGAEDVPHHLFSGGFDAPVPRESHYRDGAARSVVDPSALLQGLNEQQRAAVEHTG